MKTPTQTLLNKPIFIAALSILLTSYTLMALVSYEWVRLTLSPIGILIGFALVVFSITLPANK